MPDPKDAADLHVERWRDHWLDIGFDDEVEALMVRAYAIVRFMRGAKHAAAEQMGMQDFEYETLHTLMIRDTPGHASPGALAQELGVSNAGMTGRLDALEKRGWIRRTTAVGDRRRVDVEATPAGVALWREAMDLRGNAEDELVTVLSREELVTLNRLLKKLALRIESEESPLLNPAAGAPRPD